MGPILCGLRGFARPEGRACTCLQRQPRAPSAEPGRRRPDLQVGRTRAPSTVVRSLLESAPKELPVKKAAPAGRSRRRAFVLGTALVAAVVSLPAQQSVLDTRDPKQTQDEDFAKSVKEWTTQPYFISPLVDHLPRVAGVPMPKDVLGYHIGAPAKLTYYADIVKYYRALAAATPRVRVDSIGKSDEDRELVVVWISSDDNMKNLQKNRDQLAKIADPRGLTPEQVRQLIATTKPHYHLMGGLHSGETG